MSFDIRFDTRFDPTGFFAAPEVRAALDEAERIWEGILRDELDDIPAGTAFDIEDPSALGTTRRIVLDAPIDDLLIFVGAQPLGPDTLAFGGPDGFTLGGADLGPAYEARVSGNFRGQGPVPDFEPWVGGITFDTGTSWSFRPSGPKRGEYDFLTIALHEIGHVLGFGTAPIFEALAEGGRFDGPNARAVNGGDPIPLEDGGGHVVEGFAGDSVLMDPLLTRGARRMPTEIDRAILADIGWEIAGFGTRDEIPPATDGDDTITGTAGADTLEGGAGDDRLDGGPGADILRGGTGNDTHLLDDPGDRVIERAGEGNDTILASADVTLGRAEVEAVLLTGTADLRVTGNGFATAISGNRGDNLLIGGGGGDVLTGNRGADTFVFLRGDLGTGPARIADFGAHDRIALDDRLFGLGDGRIDTRPVTEAQIAAALRAGQVVYDGQSGTLSVEDGDGPRALFVVEGGGSLAAADLLLF